MQKGQEDRTAIFLARRILFLLANSFCMREEVPIICCRQNISNYFMELATDLEGAYYGFYFMEFADYYTKEHNDERQMLRLLYQTLRALSSNKIPRELVRYIFELKTLVVNGEYPDVFSLHRVWQRRSKVFCSVAETEGLYVKSAGVQCLMES